MDYKTELQSNNTDLQALIAKANALPDVGSEGSGSGNIETCTVTFECLDDSITSLTLLQYTTIDSNGKVTGATKTSSDTTFPFSVVCVCNTPIDFIGRATSTLSFDDGIYKQLQASSSAAYFFWGKAIAPANGTAKIVYSTSS